MECSGSKCSCCKPRTGSRRPRHSRTKARLGRRAKARLGRRAKARRGHRQCRKPPVRPYRGRRTATATCNGCSRSRSKRHGDRTRCIFCVKGCSVACYNGLIIRFTWLRMCNAPQQSATRCNISWLTLAAVRRRSEQCSPVPAGGCSSTASTHIRVGLHCSCTRECAGGCRLGVSTVGTRLDQAIATCP